MRYFFVTWKRRTGRATPLYTPTLRMLLNCIPNLHCECFSIASSTYTASVAKMSHCDIQATLLQKYHTNALSYFRYARIMPTICHLVCFVSHARTMPTTTLSYWYARTMPTIHPCKYHAKFYLCNNHAITFH